MAEPLYWCLHPPVMIDQKQPGLSADEEAVYKGFRFAARQGSWLSGRFAAKRLLASILDDGLPYDQIEIVNDALGAPQAMVSGQNLGGCLSISHSDGWAAAAYAPAGLRIGIDLEVAEQRSERFIQDYFTLAEQGLLATRDELADRMATLIWSAKESMLKAMGLGLRVDTRQIQVDAIGDEALLSQPGWFSLSLSSLCRNGNWTGFWRDAGAFVITLAIILESGRELDLIQVK